MQYRCSKGKLSIDDRNIQVVGVFKRIAWTTPRNTITGVEVHPTNAFLATITFHGPGGPYHAELVAIKKAQEIAQMFQV
jgi:pyrimidine deaminase RibD-like protein